MTMTVASQVNADDIRSLLEGLYRELSSEYEQASAAVVDMAGGPTRTATTRSTPVRRRRYGSISCL